MVAGGWKKQGLTANGDGVSFRGNENVLKLDYGDRLHNPVNTLKSLNHPLPMGELYGMSTMCQKAI